MNKKRTYSIQQVAEMTGLSKQVIRKWEDRYGIITPERLDNGYRIYTEAEVARLQQIIVLTEAGHSVKQAAMLVQQEEEEQVEQPKAPTDQVKYFLFALEEAGKLADDKKILHLLEQAHHVFGIEVLLQQIIAPFLRRIGELWCEKKWGEYQEAVSSQTIRDFLANLRRRFHVPEHAPLVVGSCLPNERHEIPIHILLVQCMLRGYRTLMLGPAPAPNAIESTVRLTNPSIVLLTASTQAVWADDGQAIRAIDAFAKTVPHIKFFIGGAGIHNALQHFQLEAIQEAHSLQDVFSQ
ncbi:MerR family transcriptional regulator [Lysinibacillus sp. KU-BSD001]|uniref:MerR family transcriptional regulator n=1 Tax=Lysinibacillus sp. KU-BSD001 TaxID=3141328 RepID=UPI0036E13552